MQQSESVDESEVFSDVVSTVLQRTDPENFFARPDSYATVFHETRIAGASAVNSNGVKTYFGESLVVDDIVSMLRNLANNVELFSRVATICGYGFFL